VIWFFVFVEVFFVFLVAILIDSSYNIKAMMNKILIVVIFCLAVGTGYVLYSAKSNAQEIDHGPVDTSEDTENTVVEKSSYTVSRYTVQDGDVFASVMEALGFDYSEALAILDITSLTYDFTRIKVGKEFRVLTDEDDRRVRLEYEKDTEEIVAVNLFDPEYNTTIVPITYDIETAVIGGTVSSSLWFSGLDAGMPKELLVKFANVFAWTIDFSVQVKNGDSFRVLYEKRYRDGNYVGVGAVLAGEFVNDGDSLKAYLFENEEGNPVYFSDTGEAMQKQFLKAPLEFSRITSGFTYGRFDPINNALGPHRAIDYAAAIGTPVMAVGDGVVRFAGWDTRGFGNFVSIHHNDTYTTEYAHLSKFGSGITVGAHVKQGQIIGYVGSTGHSTGPHLHYQIKKDGTLVNPLEIELPPGDPVPDEKIGEFDQLRSGLDEQLFHL